jgi:parallel beta-helix repeat protein
MKSRNIIPRLAILAATLAFVALVGSSMSDTIPSREAGQPAMRGWQSTTIAASSAHAPILIDGNAALDAFCLGNGTTGLTPATAHVIHDYDVNASYSGSGIVIQNTTRYLVIRNCTATGSGSVTTNAGFKLVNCTNVNITGCNASRNWGSGIYLFHCNESTISGNTANNNAMSGIYLWDGCYGNTISGNTVNDNLGAGILLYIECDGNAIIHNTAGNARSPAYQLGGISLDEDCDNNTISGNIANHNTDFGIGLHAGCDGNVIMNNTAGSTGRSNQKYGIFLLFECDGNTISGNTARDNTQHGIHLYNLCDNNTVSGNIANDNTLYGIFLQDQCNVNQITGNTVQHNDVGIFLNITSDGNLIYHNRLLFNYLGNANDNGTSNSWDNGTAGNHWDDYTGYDADDDGIGEEAYKVNGSAHALDRKPLVNTIPRFSTTAADLSYEVGTAGHLVSWLVGDDTPWLLSYSVSIDGLVVSSGALHGSSATITASVNGLSIGTHVVTLEVVDGYGSKSSDGVIVTVTGEDPITALSNTIITGLVLVAIIIAAAIILHGLLVRKRNAPASTGLLKGAKGRDVGL